MNPKTLRTGIATRLRSITGLLVYERFPGPSPNPPCAIVDLVAAEPEQTMGRGDLTRFDFTIEILMPLTGGWENAQDRLEPLLATSSTGGVFGAIAGDRTLGGNACACFVKGLPNAYERRALDGGAECLAATVNLEVWAT